MNQSVRGIFVAIALSQGLGLQAQVIKEFAGEQLSSPWAPGQGSFGRSVAGRLSANAIPDVVVLCGSTPILLLDVGPRDVKQALPLQCSDLDVLRAGGQAGLDALVSVSPFGLSLTRLDTTTQGFVTTLVDGSDWAAARLVRGLDIDGDGLDDLVGVQADGVTIRTLLSSGIGGSFVLGPQSVASAPVRDLCAVQWDADPALEFALLTDLGVEVLEADGTLRDSWTSILPGGALARLKQVGQATDRLAWITAYAPPALQLLMTLAPGGAIQDALDLGALDAFSAVGSDYDLDGDDDLLVSHHFSNELIQFDNMRTPQTPNGPSFAASASGMTLFRVGPPDLSATLNEATPVSADLDGDGDLDVLYAGQTSLTLEILLGESVDAGARKLPVSAGVWLPEAPGAQGELVLTLDAPAVLEPGATHIQAVVWQRDGLGAALAPQAAYEACLELPVSWPMKLNLSLDETQVEFSKIYCIELRLVALDSTGEVLEAFPATIGDFSTSGESVAILMGKPDALGHVDVPTNTEEAEGMGVASYVMRPRTSAFAGAATPSI